MNDDTTNGPPDSPAGSDATAASGDEDLPRISRLLREEPVEIDPDRRRRTIEHALAAADATPARPPLPARRLRQLAVAAAVVLVAGVGALVASDLGGDGADTTQEAADATGTADDATTSSTATPPTTVTPAAPEDGGGSATSDEGAPAVPDVSARSGTAGDLGEFDDADTLLDALVGGGDPAAAAPPGTSADPCPGPGRRHLGTASLTDPTAPPRVSVAVLDDDATIVVLDPDGCEEIARRES